MGPIRRHVIALTAVMGLAAPAIAAPASLAAESADPPGTVIAVAPLPADQWLPGTGRAHHVTYVSTGVGDQPVPVTGAVFVPEGMPPAGGWPVVSWAHGTVGLGDPCAPTVAGRSQRDIDYLSHWLVQGYAIVATDYAGLGGPGVHPYLAGEIAAFGTIDMVRAAHAVEDSLAGKWVVIGQSQGGQATLFTTNVAAEYAPELDFRGGVATGPPSNLEYVVSGANQYIPDVDQPYLTAFLAYILAGLRAAAPDFPVNDYLSDLGVEVVADAEDLCYDEMVARVTGIGVGELLSKPLTDAAFFGALRAIMAAPTSGYDRPFYIAQGLLDTVVFPPLTAKLVAELTANRQPLTFRGYPSDHSGTMRASLPDTTPYVADLFAGDGADG